MRQVTERIQLATSRADWAEAAQAMQALPLAHLTALVAPGDETAKTINRLVVSELERRNLVADRPGTWVAHGSDTYTGEGGTLGVVATEPAARSLCQSVWDDSNEAGGYPHTDLRWFKSGSSMVAKGTFPIRPGITAEAVFTVSPA
jgi:hypothetical protein